MSDETQELERDQLIFESFVVIICNQMGVP